MVGSMGDETGINGEQLLEQARAGTPQCLGRLLQYYYNYLELLAATHIDEKLQSRCSPSDIVQETCCEAHRDFAKFRGQTEAEFLGWLRMILVNNMAREVEKHLLAAKRDVRREISLDAMGAALERSAARLESVLVDRGNSPSSRINRDERTVLLANLLAALPSDYRKVLVLRHCEGLPFKDIAQRMERSPGAVRMLWLRAIGEVRQQVSARGLP
jgi:RNA polymerase sigma-70 factor, ECF subfamily